VRRLTVIAVGVVAYVLVGSTAVFGQRPGKTLYEAAATGDAAAVKEYVDKKVDLSAPDAQGNTALSYAVDAYNIDVVKLLLGGGANPNPKDRNGATPLMAASMSGQKEVIEALLAAKADHTIKNPSGATALHCAVMMGQYEITELLIKAGADVNAKDNAGQMPLSVAQSRNQPEIADLLKEHGATAPVIQDPYGMYGGNAASQAGTVTGATSQRPADFKIDPNAIRKQLAETASLQAPLKVIDANSESEQRTWIARRADNRTTMLRAVQKQFEDEMAFVKRTAKEENAEKTAKAVDDLVAARKNRYKLISEQLRDQRRQTLLESRESGTTGRGAGMSRSSRGRGAASGGPGMDAYGNSSTSQTRASRRAVAEANEPPVDPDTQSQTQSWLSAKAEDKDDLLKTVHELDVVEYAVLHKSAEDEKAAKTQVAIMALLMLREERIAKIQQKWKADDERAQRMMERGGTNGVQDMQQGTQQGMRRGGRR
jgi:hypothetical protein